MTDVNVERNLIGIEDLLVGHGEVVQQRGGIPVTVNKINAANFPYDTDLTLQEKIDSLDTTHYVDNNNLPVYIATPHSSSNLNLADVIWIKDISSTEKHVYYFDKLMFKYNPSIGNLILDSSLFSSASSTLTLAFQSADTALYNTIAGVINQVQTDLRAADTSIYSAFQAADTALIASLTLGTAAHLNTGTSAGNVVALDSTGKLPAINGSNLTDLPVAATPAGFILKKLYYENITSSSINGSGQHQISTTNNNGYILFNINYSPISSGNKLIIKIICPTQKGSSTIPLATALLYVNGNFVRCATTRVEGILTVEYQFIIPNSATQSIITKIGIVPAGDSSGYYYINNTLFGSDSMGATITIEEVKV